MNYKHNQLSKPLFSSQRIREDSIPEFFSRTKFSIMIGMLLSNILMNIVCSSQL